jgi:hypothetical protein
LPVNRPADHIEKEIKRDRSGLVQHQQKSGAKQTQNEAKQAKQNKKVKQNDAKKLLWKRNKKCEAK